MERALPQIARAIDQIAAALRKGGRLIYVGAGTSGRIAALDASECGPPSTPIPGPCSTSWPEALSLVSSTEASEDATYRPSGNQEGSRASTTSCRHRHQRTNSVHHRSPRIRPSHGARTIALTCNRNSQLENVADFAIVTEVGAEVLAGSSRMKAGTAHKMVLNMISTGAMTRLGYVYGNLMVNVLTKNEKLVQRAIRIVEQATGADHETSRHALESSGNRTPVAVVMLAAGVNKSQAAATLKQSKGHVRQAIALAKT